jgi:hypothetical protein
VQIAYSDVPQVGPNLSKAAKVAIIMGAAVGVGILIMFWAFGAWSND